MKERIIKLGNRILKDTLETQGMRNKLINEIQRKGINDEAVLKAMREIPRHFFLPAGLEHFAYLDKPFDIGEGQTISQPYTVAFQTELLDVKPDMKVLEIGTGSGYQAAVLAQMGAQVFTIERILNLHLNAKDILSALGYNNIQCFLGDGYEGLPQYAPYDRIIITAAVDQIPDSLKDQLKIGGIIVAPVSYTLGTQVMTRLLKEDENNFKEEKHGFFTFVPMLPGIKKN
ncbi:MAG: protein-L-isoaspartate(D-aspartate) O-methyltransferase [Bacteroidales bacterium]|jgi:protein-L-isoaspartate(D-aspartate) O-methyltransferase|nr:protein-L-isoaspartate(D-aspartate) O-methyltransferase [Bacteroidales bacterium]MDI9575203.1 protein-L-isoaspartate(D-aspartate) O-methyltransferase [Bacteroidota bacterium]MDD2593385.1 protein-L-isoaspartate(D-aspartate) O-methyltransferase [Bacteroidales bacterium]MDD3756008.1 protein-L-isoaspartate(D-aspartate) O-methyltransferase [Bacteroidales bacterium]MDY0400963.1 protein-L-isoaspartate(D-aspartate) O-methyltransferase [Bacteroidales bacterium]